MSGRSGGRLTRRAGRASISRMAARPTHVLFLCLGNICRSPLAEGVFRAEVERRGLGAAYVIDSAGTGGWHAGDGPDRRSVAVARKHGVDIGAQRARQLHSDDFTRFDWIVAMDGENLRVARERAGRAPHARLVRFTSFVPDAASDDVPDPYYGGPEGFDDVYELLASGAGPLLDMLEAEALRDLAT